MRRRGCQSNVSLLHVSLARARGHLLSGRFVSLPSATGAPWPAHQRRGSIRIRVRAQYGRAQPPRPLHADANRLGSSQAACPHPGHGQFPDFHPPGSRCGGLFLARCWRRAYDDSSGSLGWTTGPRRLRLGGGVHPIRAKIPCCQGPKRSGPRLTAPMTAASSG